MKTILDTSHGKFIVRDLTPDDEKQVIDLWETVFHKDMDHKMWRWKYVDNPFKARQCLCLDEAGEIVVLYGGLVYPGNCQGKDAGFVFLMDIMSHPDYRKSGLFVRTGKTFINDWHGENDPGLLYGIPGKYHFEIGKKYLDYRCVEPGTSYLSADTESLARSGRTLFRGGIKKISPSGFPAALFDKLWKRCKKAYPYCVKRNAAFVSWRFFSHPLQSYDIYVHTSFTGRADGYAAVLQDGDKAVIVDFFTVSCQRVISDFWSLLAKELRGRGGKTMETWLPGNHFQASAAVKAGFNPSAEPLGIVPTFYRSEKSPDINFVEDNFYYSMADADLF
jgi:hypothetical protein